MLSTQNRINPRRYFRVHIIELKMCLLFAPPPRERQLRKQTECVVYSSYNELLTKSEKKLSGYTSNQALVLVYMQNSYSIVIRPVLSTCNTSELLDLIFSFSLYFGE